MIANNNNTPPIINNKIQNPWAEVEMRSMAQIVEIIDNPR
jgi:hypothetical protein